MDISIKDEGEDFADVYFKPGEDDPFGVDGYGHDVTIRVPLYAHEAAELIELLAPLAARKEEN